MHVILLFVSHYYSVLLYIRRKTDVSDSIIVRFFCEGQSLLRKTTEKKPGIMNLFLKPLPSPGNIVRSAGNLSPIATENRKILFCVINLLHFSDISGVVGSAIECSLATHRPAIR